MSKAKHNSLSPKLGLFDAINYFILFLLAIITIFPLYYVVIVSLATQADIQKHLIYILPYSINFDAYAFVFKNDMIYSATFVSIFITLAGTFLSMLISTAAGYTLSKKRIPGSKIMFAFVVIPLFFTGGLIPNYLTIKSYGLINNIFVLILPSLINTFYLILIKNFFEEIPASIEESAKIDGANDIIVLYKIVLPMAAPIIATMSLFYAVDKWNDYFSALLYISNDRLKPLQLVLRQVLVDYTTVTSSAIGASIAASTSPIYQLSLQMAIIVVATIPIFIVYPFLQKYFAKGIIVGAVKE